MSDPILNSILLTPEQNKARPEFFHPSVNVIDFQEDQIETSIPAKFEAMVRIHPHRIAFKTKKQTLTYEELNQGANRLAHAMSDRRGSKSEPVVLIMKQDAAYLTAMLGVLKAGKFCVYIDPSYPAAYQSALLKDSQAEVIITNQQRAVFRNELLQAQGRLLLNIDDLKASLPIENLELPIASDSAANIFYTSGSTGDPKGVIQSHRYVLYKAFIDKLFVTEADRLVQVGRLSGEIFNVLLNGATFFSWNAKENGLTELADWLASERITTYRSIPSLFRYFCMQVNDRADLSSVRKIILGGEPVYRKDVEFFKRYFAADCILINKYGGGEAGPISWFVVTKETEIAGNILPAGYLFPGKSILLYEHSSSAGPVDSVGEIAVKSRYLASGYWNKNDLTQAAFTAVPDEKAESIYRTGDLGSIDRDGCLTYHGRSDARLKIRGYSVDLTEVEAAILEHKEIKEAVVTAQSLEGSDKALIAYYVPIAENSATPSAVRAFLRQTLPDYMLPARYVALEKFPRTATGKVDIRELTLPARARPDIETPFVAPRAHAEKEVARLWAEVLGLDGVGVDDDFFELGGHSLAATRVVARVLQEFRIQIPVQSLFESPTVAKMAEIIGRHQNNKIVSENVDSILNDLEALSEQDAQQLLLNSGGKGQEKGRRG